MGSDASSMVTPVQMGKCHLANDSSPPFRVYIDATRCVAAIKSHPNINQRQRETMVDALSTTIATKLLSSISDAIDNTLVQAIAAANTNNPASPNHRARPSNPFNASSNLNTEVIVDSIRELLPFHFSPILFPSDDLLLPNEREWKEAMSQALEVESRIKLQELVVSYHPCHEKCWLLWRRWCRWSDSRMLHRCKFKTLETMLSFALPSLIGSIAYSMLY